MNSSYKPAGYNSVSPYLAADGASRTVEFLVQVFDAIELRRFLHPECRVMHAEVRIDDTVVMLTDGANPEYPAIASNVHVYVPDVDATYKRALDAGATSVQEPVQKEDADKRGGVKDPGGTTWWIATTTKLITWLTIFRSAVIPRAQRCGYAQWTAARDQGLLQLVPPHAV